MQTAVVHYNECIRTGNYRSLFSARTASAYQNYQHLHQMTSLEVAERSDHCYILTHSVT